MCFQRRRKCNACHRCFDGSTEPCDNPGSPVCRATSQVQSDFAANAVPPHLHLDCQGTPTGVEAREPLTSGERERKKAQHNEANARYRDTHKDQIRERARNPKYKESSARYQAAHREERRDQLRARDQQRAEAARANLVEKLQNTTNPEDRLGIENQIRRSDNVKKQWKERKDRETAETMAAFSQGGRATGPGEPERRVEAQGQRRQREESDSPNEQERKRRVTDDKEKRDRDRRDRDVWGTR